MIKVMIIDDSMIVRQLLTKIITSKKGMEVVGVVANPYKAVDLMRTVNPDVITLDVEMPRMDGIEFMKKLNKNGFFKVLMISSLTAKGAKVTMEALGNGALDYVFKPKSGSKEVMEQYSNEIEEKILACVESYKANPVDIEEMALFTRDEEVNTADVILPKTVKEVPSNPNKIIAIGSSTGGTEAIKSILSGLDGNVPGIVIAQHMPKDFTKAFAERLNRLSRVNVKEAEEGDMVLPGHVYIAPGDAHLVISRRKNNYICHLKKGKLVKRHMPSCDVLFRSVANEAAQNAIGIILTGMGSDGAAGMLELKKRGGKTIGQNAESCVVYGMPREAKKLNAIDTEVPLRRIPEVIMDIIIDGET